MTFIAVVHVIVAITLIVLVLIQDSKGNGALGMGGVSNSNSILGATGAQTFASKLTVVASIMFAFTCIGLSYYTSMGNKSVIDSLPVAPVTAPESPQTTEPATTQAAPAATTESTATSVDAKAETQPSTGSTTK